MFDLSEEIQSRRRSIADNIAKAFQVDSEASYFEKAHDVGDIHPNGKWVWKEYKPGKFDWRVAKKSDNQKKNEVLEDTYRWSLNKYKNIQNSFNINLLPSISKKDRIDYIERVKDKLKNSKYKDSISVSEKKGDGKVIVLKTPYSKIMEGIKDEYSNLFIQNKKKERERKIKEKDEYDKSKKYKMYFNEHKELYDKMIGLFGKETFANDYNKHKLLRYLTGDSDTFEGCVGYSWKQGLENSGSLDGNKIDFERLKKEIENFQSSSTSDIKVGR